MTEPRPLVCVFLKLPPSYRPVSRIHEIAWNELLPQVERMNRAFVAAQAAHPSSEAKKIWKEARKVAAKRLKELREVMFKNYGVASAFVRFLGALRKERYVAKTYDEFQDYARSAVEVAGIAQEAIIQFREDLRIAVSRITDIMNGDAKEMSSLTAETNQSLLEVATAVEECGALLEEFRDEFTEVQQQSSDDKNNPPSDEELQIAEEKWLAFKEVADRVRFRWETLMDEVRGYEEGFEPPMTPPNDPSDPTAPSSPLKNKGLPFWRKFFRFVSSCITPETIA